MKVNKLIDHTLLKPDAKEEDIKRLCAEAREYDFMSVCVNPGYVSLASKELKGSDVKVCTVIGFPLGANTVETKCFEASNVVDNGAEEVDMVINISKAKDHDYDYLEDEIRRIKAACKGRLLKVIIESCLLSDDEIVNVCKAAKKAGADFVKTSTGFSKFGATTHAVSLMRQTVGSDMGVKASGGVHNYQELLDMVNAGASRIGASAGVAIMKEVK